MADDSLMSQDEIERLLNQARVTPDDAPKAADPAAAANSGAAQPAPSPPITQAAASPDEVQKSLGQSEIDSLLGKPSAAPEPAVRAEAPPRPSSPGEEAVAQADLEYLLSQAERALESIDAAPGPVPTGVASFRLEEFSGAPASQEVATLDLIRDVELDLKIELGRTNMYLEDVLKLRKGSVVPLDKLAGDPVDIYVNDRLVARGEVLVLNDNFCVRVAELIAGANAGA